MSRSRECCAQPGPLRTPGRWSAVIPRAAAGAVTGAAARVAATALAAAIFGCALTGTAQAAPPGWGPDRVPHLSGVICTGPAGSAALASWPSAATTAPAYAVAPVVAGPGGVGATQPAVNATAAVALDGPQSTALGYLLGRHGRATDPATVGDVAAAVEEHAGAPADASTAACLASGTGGISRRGADELWAEATRLAGPYTVRLTASSAKLVLGHSAVVTAVVTARSGAPVPGMTVSWDTSEPSARLGRDTAVTDEQGRASATITVQPGSRARAVPVEARAEVPGPPVLMSAPGAVSLVAAGDPRTISGSTQLPVDTTADPSLRLAADRTVVLPGATMHPQLTVSGMRGHSGTATLSVTGPLPIRAKTGCRTYHGGTPHAPSADTVSTPGTAVKGDGTVPGGPLTLARPGCYLVTSRIVTSDAIPQVDRSGGELVVAAAPVYPTITTSGHGVSTAGTLSAKVAVNGDLPATIADVHGTLAGPRMPNDGSCHTATFGSDGTPLSGAVRHGAAVVTTNAAVTAPGCYQFRVSGTIRVPALGTVAWSAPLTATTLVLRPVVSVVGLSASDVSAGGRISATVSVAGTWAQPGAVRLRLRRLPYNWRGCFGRDWTHAQPVGEPGPPLPTNGDGSYTVRSPAVPGEGCWTVVPVLTISANPAIWVPAAGPIDPMTAFTGMPDVAQADALHKPLDAGRDDGLRIVIAALGVLALLGAAVMCTLSMARRDLEADPPAGPGPLIVSPSA